MKFHIELLSSRQHYSQILIIIGFTLGLILRILMLFHKGMSDMDAYIDWGTRTLNQGLSEGFIGVYFPFQYQLFSLASYFVSLLNADFWIIFKGMNLLFDIGIFIIIIKIMSILQINKMTALFYWLHPWFLIFFSLGYIDFHFAFFILLSIYLLLRLKKPAFTGYVISGIPIGFAFLMKPQTQPLIIGIACLIVLYCIKTKKIDLTGLLAPSTVLFTGYTLYFFLSSKSIIFLAKKYLNIVNVMPCLNAQLFNIWFPMAYLMRTDPAGAIYSVSDNIYLLPYITFRTVAFILTIASIVYYCYRLFTAFKDKFDNSMFLLLFGFCFFTLPFLMTSGHENHFFLASIFLLIISMKGKDRLFRIAAHTTLAMNYINLALLYSGDPFSEWIRKIIGGYTIEIMLACALISLPFLFYIYLAFFRMVKTNPLRIH